MVTVIILAAGKGTRMNDKNIPKVCRKIGKEAMIKRVVKTALQLSPENICIVVSLENKNSIQAALRSYPNLIYVVQRDVNGTGSAVLSASSIYTRTDILVLLGDVPLIKESTLRKCLGKNCILGFQDDNLDNKFGRIILKDNHVERIVEYSEATEEERKITTVNSGILSLQNEHIRFLSQINNNNSKKEYYLTDIVKILKDKQIPMTYIEGDKSECIGVNTPVELEEVNKLLNI